MHPVRGMLNAMAALKAILVISMVLMVPVSLELSKYCVLVACLWLPYAEKG